MPHLCKSVDLFATPPKALVTSYLVRPVMSMSTAFTEYRVLSKTSDDIKSLGEVRKYNSY